VVEVASVEEAMVELELVSVLEDISLAPVAPLPEPDRVLVDVLPVPDVEPLLLPPWPRVAPQARPSAVAASQDRDFTLAECQTRRVSATSNPRPAPVARTPRELTFLHGGASGSLKVVVHAALQKEPSCLDSS
jgi:hypothetical protein